MQFSSDDIVPKGTGFGSDMLELIADSLSAGIMLYDAQDRIIYASRRIQSLLNLPAGNVDVGSNLRAFYSAYYDARRSADPLFPRLKRSLSREEWVAENLAAHWKERCETEDRLPAKRWLRFSRRRMADGTGLCLITDISEQKRSERQWRMDIDRVQVIEEILDRLDFPITVTNQDHIYVGANKAACRFMQKPLEAIIGTHIADAYVPSLAARIVADNQMVIDSGEALNVPERIGSPSGEEQLYITHKTRVGKAGMHHVLTWMEDVTTFASRNHDGAFSLPGLGELNFLRSPENAGVKQPKHSGSTPRVLLVCLDEAMAQNAKTRLTLCGMEADYLVSDAEVAALASLAGGVPDIDLVLLSEEFDARAISHLTQAGFRTERISLREISQSITDIVCTTLNVRCSLCRKADKPMHRQKDCALCEAQTPDTDRVDVLVAEDNPINQIVFSQILDGLNIKYRIYSTVAELSQGFARHAPRIIFMDTTLPDMDAFAASLSLRALEVEKGMAPTPIIGVVALAFEGDREKCLASGMNDMLLKPLSPDMIEEMLGNYAENWCNASKISRI